MVKPLAYVLWAICATLTLFVAALPLGVEAQLALVCGALLAMGVIKMLRLRGPFRPIFLGFGTFVILRYLFWRISNTVPSVASPLDFGAGFILVCAEIYCIVMMFLSLFTVADPIDRPRAPRVSDDEALSVDVFIPTYNESIEILAPTLAAALRMTYPNDKVKVFLLDDGGTEAKVQAEDEALATAALNRRVSLKALCDELGAHYLTREENSHAKAGNLNHGMLHTEGELVAVFDADHVPAADFLIETAGYFSKDNKLFLVQTPHFFLNPDPIEKNIGAVRMPAENEMFYSLVQKGLDKWNAAFFCGSAALLRRSALEQVGGFQGSSITEDAETALELHARGWKSLYVDKPMVAGLQPETFDSFIGQRSRWCRGMVQILLMKCPLFLRGLTAAQRLCYLASSMFWLFPLSRMTFVFAPMLFIFFGMKIYIANEQEFLAYTVTYMIAALMIQSYVFGRVRWPWASDLYEYIQSVLLFRAVIGVFINPRRPKFNVTAKGQTLNENHLSGLATPYFVIFAAVAVSMVVLGFRYVHEPNLRGLITVVGVWSGLNLILSGIALGAVCELRERRSVPRVASRLKASLLVGADSVPVRIEDMSFGGLKVRIEGMERLLPRGKSLLRLESADGSGAVLETPVTGAGRRVLDDGRGLGLRFSGVNGDRFKIVAKVVFANIGSISGDRRSMSISRGIILGTLQFSVFALVQTARGLYYLTFRRAVPTPSAMAPAAKNSAA